jgi:hypothetical protein
MDCFGVVVLMGVIPHLGQTVHKNTRYCVEWVGGEESVEHGGQQVRAASQCTVRGAKPGHLVDVETKTRNLKPTDSRDALREEAEGEVT